MLANSILPLKPNEPPSSSQTLLVGHQIQQPCEPFSAAPRRQSEIHFSQMDEQIKDWVCVSGKGALSSIFHKLGKVESVPPSTFQKSPA